MEKDVRKVRADGFRAGVRRVWLGKERGAC